MYMCVLGLCVYVRVGRPGRSGTRPTGEGPSGMSAGMSQVSMSPKSSVLPTSPLLLRSLLFLSHRIGINHRFILQTKRMSLYFTYSKYINVGSNSSCFPYLQTQQRSSYNAVGRGQASLQVILPTYIHTYINTYIHVHICAKRHNRPGGVLGTALV
jgi:hypothetical protein